LREPGLQTEDEVDNAKQGMAKHARCQQLHDASEVDRLSSRLSKEGLAVGWAIRCDDLAQFVDYALVDHAMACDGLLIDFVKGFHP
jgi:hypothetical protein